MTYEEITFEKEERVAIITFNRPDKLNALSPRLRVDIAQAIDAVSDDEETRVVVVTGAGRGFCSGADLSIGGSNNPADLGLGERHRLDPVGWLCIRIHHLHKPTIAAVNGVAAGAGLSLALACDMRIASETARFGSIFVKRGLVPDNGSTYFLPKLVGVAKACELMFVGDFIDAKEAERIGMVNGTVPPDQLMPVTMDLAIKIAKGPPLAIQLTKRAIYKGLTRDLTSQVEYEAYTQAIAGATEDAKEGVRAFIEKREPEFKGK